MRKSIYMFMAAGLLLSACVKENRSGSAEGTPVLFSASTVETRTTYTDDVTGGYERIDWSANDQIKINCLQTTPESATYKIGSWSDSGKQSQATGITCISGNQLQWGSDTHRFFAVYPSSAGLTVSGSDSSTKGTMSGTIPATQDGSPALSSYGYMYASATESNPGRYQSVNLAFRPLFNAVEFSLKAGDSETAAQLTSIVLSSSSENLAGPFSAEWTAGSTAPTVTPASSGVSQSVTISTSVSLSQETARKFTFITMPITQNNLTLTLNYANYYSRTLTLKDGSGTAVSLSPGERVVFGEISVPKKIVHVSSISLSNASVNVGSTVTLTPTVLPENATNKNVTWSSSDEGKATVNSSGEVTGVSAGDVTITATAQDGSGVSGSCTVTVTATQYTITFKSGNTVYIKTNSTQPSAVIDQGQSYISSFSNTWSGMEDLVGECWFVNSSGYLNPPSNLGSYYDHTTVTLTMALSSAGQKNVKRIVMNVKWVETHPVAKEIKVNGEAPKESISASSSTGTDLSFTMDSSKTMTSIAIFMNCTKFQIKSITVEY